MKELKLTEKDEKILSVIKEHCGSIGPTQIGLILGQTYSSASAYCNNSIKKLVKAGKIKRFKGKYSIVLNQ